MHAGHACFVSFWFISFKKREKERERGLKPYRHSYSDCLKIFSKILFPRATLLSDYHRKKHRANHSC